MGHLKWVRCEAPLEISPFYEKQNFTVVCECAPCLCDSKNMPHGTIWARLPTVTPHRTESGSAGQTGRPNREPRASNPEVRAPGSTPTTLAWLWVPYAHLGRQEAALSPPRGA
jgi:hypothetical protein